MSLDQKAAGQSSWDARDKCMMDEEQKARLLCAQGFIPGHGRGNLDAAACMEHWAEGITVTGGATGTSGLRSVTDGTASLDGNEGSAGLRISDKPELNIGFKDTHQRGTNHADTVAAGTSDVENHTSGSGYRAHCQAVARDAYERHSAWNAARPAMAEVVRAQQERATTASAERAVQEALQANTNAAANALIQRTLPAAP